MHFQFHDRGLVFTQRQSRRRGFPQFLAVLVLYTSSITFTNVGMADDPAPAQAGPQSAAPPPAPQQPAAQQLEAISAPVPAAANSKAGEEAVPQPFAVTASSAAANSNASAVDGASTNATSVNRDGRVLLNFRDEDWLPALRWLARELKLNLDWQTLPEGKLSLFSANDYTLEEAEDLINMQLLARGYTLLKRGEVLRLVPMKDIDITLVPRVQAEELEAYQKHQVVRLSIPLEWMVAEKAVAEFKPLLSPHGQMFPLASSNRLEVLDAVVNLRELVRLIKRAESDDGRRVRVMEFRLKYRKATEIAVQVRQLIGLPPDSSVSTSASTQLDIEQARFRAEAVKQLGNNARDLLTDKKPDTFLVVNEKENSIVVNAPPDKLEMVRQTVETLDKPLPEGDSSWQTISRVKVHPVGGFDPETISRLLLALQERGNLAKETRIQHEAAYNRIIAFASPEDQLTIAQLIESYRAEKRSAAVIELHSVSPTYAVKAVQLILKNPERPSSTPGVPSDGKFQIEADPEHSRLLMWATSDEIKEVREFLLSLGETFEDKPRAENAAPMHVVSVAPADVNEITQRLREVWQDVSDVPLVIERRQSRNDVPSLLPPENGDAAPAQLEPGQPAPAPAASKTRPDVSQSASDSNIRLVSSSMDSAPSVRVIEGKKGDLVILSRDAKSASMARQLIEELKPEPGDLRVIPLRYAQAFSVRRQLQEIMDNVPASTASPKLSSPEPRVSIESDSRTNRLFVRNCSAKQLQTIHEYVQLFDQPPADQERMTRQQRVYRVKHRRVREVLDVVKEVYRDLLSGNDRAFSGFSSNRPMGYNKNLAATVNNPEYQGLMAVGADEEANLLVISAPGYLIEEIVKLAESVDTPSDGPAMAVVSAAGDVTDAKLREALSKILRKR